MVIKLLIHLLSSSNLCWFTKKKAKLTEGSSFGSSAILSKDPPLSVPFSRRVWLYRDRFYLLGVLFLLKAFKNLTLEQIWNQRRRWVFRYQFRIFWSNFKGLSYSTPPPLEGESIIREIELRIPEILFLSILKWYCENYLFYRIYEEVLV